MVEHMIAGGDYSMRRPHQAIRHARAALRQAAASIAQFRAQLESERYSGVLDYRAIGKAWLRDLERMHATLSEQFFELVSNPEEAVAERCRDFFSGYDAFLDQIRNARLELARELLPTQTDQASGETGNARGTEADPKGPPSRISSEEAVLILGRLRRQMHWMADDVLSSMLGVGLDAAPKSGRAEVAFDPCGAGGAGAGSTVGLRRRLRRTLDRRIAARRAAASKAVGQ